VEANRAQIPLKRIADIVLAFCGLIVLAPLLLGIALWVRLGSGAPVLHRELRSGRGDQPFTLLKFRTLKSAANGGASIAPDDDPRITGPGHVLRRSRLDELPQLYNVLRGDMSLVGPRPMVAAHLDLLERVDRQALLSVRPGLTGPAAIRFFTEDTVLAGNPNAESLYLQRLLPAKIRVQLDYLSRWSLWLDLHILLQTLARVWSRRARENSRREVAAILAGGESGD